MSAILCSRSDSDSMDGVVLEAPVTYAEIARKNARYLAEYAGSFAKFAERVEMSDSQVSQFLGKKPSKNIGPKTARRIEEAFGKPLGWLDQVHELCEDQPPATASINGQLSKELSRRC